MLCAKYKLLAHTCQIVTNTSTQNAALCRSISDELTLRQRLLVSCIPGAVLRWGRGALALPSSDALVVPPPPDSKANWPFWRDFWDPMHNAPKSKFSGVPPCTLLEELTALPRPSTWWGGAYCPLPRTLPGFYGSQGLTHLLQSWQPY